MRGIITAMVNITRDTPSMQSSLKGMNTLPKRWKSPFLPARNKNSVRKMLHENLFAVSFARQKKRRNLFAMPSNAERAQTRAS
mmetsp:Transcript_88210/g.138267  ORF Transcript_88210/g.138267 Transcript_88210/m.138267 type:complete len:83 (+) Transcript_88210:396-644(+)